MDRSVRGLGPPRGSDLVLASSAEEENDAGGSHHQQQQQQQQQRLRQQQQRQALLMEQEQQTRYRLQSWEQQLQLREMQLRYDRLQYQLQQSTVLAATKPAAMNQDMPPATVPVSSDSDSDTDSLSSADSATSSFDAQAPSSPALLPLSQIPCSPWEKVGGPIGSGSFGTVYRGYNRELHQYCAIKEVQIIEHDTRSEERVRQLEQEIRLLIQCKHINIVEYYDSIRSDDTLSIYMEYAPMGSIHDLLANDGPFEESRIRNYAAQILSGLAFLHGKKLIHRDIKGANILVGPKNEVKLADFGLAKHIDTLTAMYTSCRGTPWWMAPEVILSTYSGRGYNVSADIWSLGCTVIEMATGKPPLHGYGKVQAIFKIANEKTYIPEIPDVLSDEGKKFLQLCLQRDPKARPSAAELMDHPFIRNQGS